MTPDDTVALAKATGCASIAYTYSEPVAWYEYTYDTAKVARAAGVKNVLVTSGYIRSEPLRDLAQWIDAAHVDLKGFDDAMYQKLNAGHLQPVLDAIRTLREQGVWVEIINLIVPTYTDHLPTIRRMCDWLAREVSPDVPLHFSRFHPAHRLTHLPPTPVDTLLRARDEARAAGLRYVYIGNVREVPDAGTTYCPNCHKPVVERDVFSVTSMRLRDGRCEFCQTPIPGVWKS
jgi:pyruvate formate lyase activating enzyme